jgi:hypothetical protein
VRHVNGSTVLTDTVTSLQWPAVSTMAVLSPDQMRVVTAAVHRRRHIELQGGPGSGKTTVLSALPDAIDRLPPDARPHLLYVATTGQAAQLLSARLPRGYIAQTIHTAFGIPVGATSVEAIHTQWKKPTYQPTRRQWLTAPWLMVVVDEASMLHVDLFDTLLGVLSLRQPPAYTQLVLSFDLFQLAPVDTTRAVALREPGADDEAADVALPPNYFFASTRWAGYAVDRIALSSTFRCNGNKHLRRLIRSMTTPPFVVPPQLLDDINAWHYVVCPALPPNALIICSYNVTVDAINDAHLEQLPGDSIAWPCGLALKIGARVVATQNRPQEGYYCGSRGTVAGFGHVAPHYPIVLFDLTQQCTEVCPLGVAPMGRDRGRGQGRGQGRGRGRATRAETPAFTCIPLQLAWATTTFRAQGSEADVVVVAEPPWTYGEVYVALTRARKQFFLGFALEPAHFRVPDCVKAYFTSPSHSTHTASQHDTFVWQ